MSNGEASFRDMNDALYKAGAAVTELKVMHKLAALVSEVPRPRSENLSMGKKIAAVQCLTVRSRQRHSGTLTLQFRHNVGTAFAFSRESLFTSNHLIKESDPEFEVDGVYISNPLNPMRLLYKVDIVGTAPDLDVAVLRCRQAHFSPLPLLCTSLQGFPSLYTVQRVQCLAVTIHQGHGRQRNAQWEGRCDAPSTNGCAGGPVLDSAGKVVGLLRGRTAEVEGVFTTSEGLMAALLMNRGSLMTREDWGLGWVAGSSRELPDRSTQHEELGEIPRKRLAGEESLRIKKRRLTSPYSRELFDPNCDRNSKHCESATGKLPQQPVAENPIVTKADSRYVNGKDDEFPTGKGAWKPSAHKPHPFLIEEPARRKSPPFARDERARRGASLSSVLSGSQRESPLGLRNMPRSYHCPICLKRRETHLASGNDCSSSSFVSDSIGCREPFCSNNIKTRYREDRGDTSLPIRIRPQEYQ